MSVVKADHMLGFGEEQPTGCDRSDGVGQNGDDEPDQRQAGGEHADKADEDRHGKP